MPTPELLAICLFPHPWLPTQIHISDTPGRPHTHMDTADILHENFNIHVTEWPGPWLRWQGESLMSPLTGTPHVPFLPT